MGSQLLFLGLGQPLRGSGLSAPDVRSAGPSSPQTGAPPATFPLSLIFSLPPSKQVVADFLIEVNLTSWQDTDGPKHH